MTKQKETPESFALKKQQRRDEALSTGLPIIYGMIVDGIDRTHSFVWGHAVTADGRSLFSRGSSSPSWNKGDLGFGYGKLVFEPEDMDRKSERFNRTTHKTLARELGTNRYCLIWLGSALEFTHKWEWEVLRNLVKNNPETRLYEETRSKLFPSPEDVTLIDDEVDQLLRDARKEDILTEVVQVALDMQKRRPWLESKLCLALAFEKLSP